MHNMLLKGRKKLEELRRKKAAAMTGNAAQGELEAMLTQVQNLEEKLQMVEAERDLLRRQREESLVQNTSLADDLNRARAQASQEEKTVATLRKSLENVTMERDAAFVSREDMVAQLRLVKRRLQEAEEQQYRAEEDAAAYNEHLTMTPETYNELMLRLQQQEQHRESMERQRTVNLTTQKQELQNDLLNTKRKVSDMLYGAFHGEDSFGDCTVKETEIVLDDTCEEKGQPPTKKRLRDSKEKSKRKKKGGANMNTNSTDLAQSSDEEEENKRGPNWKEHWMVNLIHLRGKMHDKFSGMKIKGVDNWGVLQTQLVAICPDFNRSSDACRKKWKKLYDDYKSNYTANGTSGSERSSKCKYYSIIDSYMHDRANVLKHVHGNATDEDPNKDPSSLLHEGEDVHETIRPPEASSSEVQGKKKTDKFVAQQAINVMAEQSVKLTDTITNSEAVKLNLLQGMLATMNELVRKL